MPSQWLTAAASSKNQWTGYLSKLKIVKNMRSSTKAFQDLLKQTSTRIPSGTCTLLILVDGILCDPTTAQNYLTKMKESGTGTVDVPQAPKILFISLPFTFSRLNDPGVFKFIRRMLWLANQQFTSYFDRGTWNGDNNGLYNRTDEMRIGLTELSILHNKVVDAIRHYRDNRDIGKQMLEDLVSRPSEEIVTTHHHRQIGDLLSIIRLLQRDLPECEVKGSGGLQNTFCTALSQLAVKEDPEDPRRRLLESLSQLPDNRDWDPEGHFLVAYDTYCRHLWMKRLGEDNIIVFYSYNQASLPRAEQGKFYERFQRQEVTRIRSDLEQMDISLGEYRTETFCIWHTAIRSLLNEERYDDAMVISSELVKRIEEPDEPQDFTPKQLNFDASMSLFLQGRALERQARSLPAVDLEWQTKQKQALGYFQAACKLRELIVPESVWDALLNWVRMELATAEMAFFNSYGNPC